MIVFGKNVAKEVINSKTKINKVYLLKKFDDKGILDYLENNNIRTVVIEKKEMDYKYKGNHQGIVALVKEISPISLETLINKKKDPVEKTDDEETGEGK